MMKEGIDSVVRKRCSIMCRMASLLFLEAEREHVKRRA